MSGECGAERRVNSPDQSLGAFRRVGSQSSFDFGDASHRDQFQEFV